MKINWSDGDQKEYPIGASVRGLKRNGARPVSITLTRKELVSLLTAVGVRYAHQVLIPALKTEVE